MKSKDKPLSTKGRKKKKINKNIIAGVDFSKSLKLLKNLRITKGVNH